VLKKIWNNNYVLSVLAGLANVLAFSPICIWPLIFLTPLLLFVAVHRCRSITEALLCGYVCSLVIMVGGFYWVVYTIHIFGHLPWIVAALGFLLFCGFGAFNFPLFACVAFYGYRNLHWNKTAEVLWFTVLLPALFTVVEWIVPKLFPWAIAHTFYFIPVVTQIAEITGASVLSFAIASLGGWGAWYFWIRSQKAIPEKHHAFRWSAGVAWTPFALWAIVLMFGAYRLNEPPPPSKPLRVGLVQANIGSLERLQASFGVGSRIQQTIEKHKKLTESLLAQPGKPDLLLWPETSMPFLLDVDYGYAFQIKQSVLAWNIPLITGSYAQVKGEPYRDYNAAFLLTPDRGMLQSQIYEKNILLAFGEYFPLGDTFPVLYRWFPQVSNFKRGTTQNLFILGDGTRVGMTICYEAIVPSFVRKVSANGIQLLVNLTNDSWFGPTSEPYQHGALSVFRAIEARVPLVRVTNTGRSFVVDRLGRMGDASAIGVEAAMVADISIPTDVQTTFFVRFGNWFVWLLAFVLGGSYLWGRQRVPIFSGITHRR
jgi:apolipoprotein N-acyltransferase